MDVTDIDECFRLLKLRRGADLGSVKQAYRQNLYKCHPDRFQGSPDLLPVAERKTKRLVEVYGVLEKWYADHGGIDPGFPSGPPHEGGGATEPDIDPEPHRAHGDGDRIARWAKIGGAIAAAGSFVIFAWSFFEGPRDAVPVSAAGGKRASAPPASPAPVEATASSAPQDPATEKATGLAALLAARDRAKVDWIKAYDEQRRREEAAAHVEMEEARLQYARDVTAQAARVSQAEHEEARLLALARIESAARRDAFTRNAEAERAALRRGYDQWLLARGGEAVALIRRIRERENSNVGVFSTTEDPAKIFAFWTADEAGGPEVNIAAKSGIAVRQPDSRYFPNFRSNIYLYEPEGRVLVGMMEKIVETHDDLVGKIEDNQRKEKAELARWDELHPPAPQPLEDGLAAVLQARDRAVERLSRATARTERAARALASAEAAFDMSDKGRDFAARIAAAWAGPTGPGGPNK